MSHVILLHKGDFPNIIQFLLQLELLSSKHRKPCLSPFDPFWDSGNNSNDQRPTPVCGTLTAMGFGINSSNPIPRCNQSTPSCADARATAHKRQHPGGGEEVEQGGGQKQRRTHVRQPPPIDDGGSRISNLRLCPPTIRSQLQSHCQLRVGPWSAQVVLACGKHRHTHLRMSCIHRVPDDE